MIMNVLKGFTSCALAALGAALATTAVAAPRTIAAPLDKFFVPSGFDDNDNIEVVAHGDFPTSCYRVGNARADVNHQAKTIEVSVTALQYDGEICAQVVTPYIKSVPVGLLEKGEYKVVAKQAPSALKGFSVAARTTESPDDHIYAPVESATLVTRFESGQQYINLKGRYPLTFVGCAVMKEVVVQAAPSDVIVVQPIMDFVQNDPRCDFRETNEFDLYYPLQTPFAGEGLLHVRVMNGNSLNTYLNVQPL
jgi:hypothetical protein